MLAPGMRFSSRGPGLDVKYRPNLRALNQKVRRGEVPLMPPPRGATARRTGTRRLRDELARLRADEANYREIVDRINSIVFRWDPEGRVIFLNDYGQRLFGYVNDEIVGRSVLGLIVPDTESSGRDLVAMIHDLLHHPERYVSNENENMRRDGERVWITWRNTPIIDAEGRLIEILSTGIDYDRPQAGRGRAPCERGAFPRARGPR